MLVGPTSIPLHTVCDPKTKGNTTAHHLQPDASPHPAKVLTWATQEGWELELGRVASAVSYGRQTQSQLNHLQIHRGLAFGVWSLIPSPVHTEGPRWHLLSGSMQSSACLSVTPNLLP